MFKFLMQGLLRDKSRSLLPIIVVTVGVMITVFLQAYINGVLNDSIEASARLITGHVKVGTRDYFENINQHPNEYALTEVETLLSELKSDFPDFQWIDRLIFGGLIDAPDSEGNTRSQGNVGGMGIRLIGSDDEIDRMELRDKLYVGRFPQFPGEVLVTNDLFQRMHLQLGDKVTLISNTMYGEMALFNFTICGTMHFGIAAIDKGMIYADIEDVRVALYMEDAASEILGFLPGVYNDKKAEAVVAAFNEQHHLSDELFAPMMKPMSRMEGMDFLITYAKYANLIIILIFVFTMSIVLWNAGLIGGLRRYGEFGLRLAIGESKHATYWSLVGESLLIGVAGTIVGTVIGLFFAYLMQTYGIDAGDMIKDATLMMPTVFRAQINAETFYIGFFPGVLSTVLGAMLAGVGIYKRQTAQLFKELEV